MAPETRFRVTETRHSVRIPVVGAARVGRGQSVSVRTFVTRQLIPVLLLPLLLGSAAIPGPGSPEVIVGRYLSALKNKDFTAAHHLLTDEMTGGKDAWAWSIEQALVFKRSALVIQDFEIYSATINGDSAMVPNILHSRDNIVNREGAAEFELYRLHKSAGRWRIDRQKLLSKRQREHWFEQRVDVSSFLEKRPAIEDDPWRDLE